MIPTVPEGTRFTRTAEQGVFGDNNGVFFGAIAVLALALVGMRMISRSKKKTTTEISFVLNRTPRFNRR